MSETFDPTRVLALLAAWCEFAEADWYDLPEAPGLGCYGTGYNAWGVQTNQKYLAAAATVAELGEAVGLSPDARERHRARALAALRFSLASHVSGELACTDGTRWGHTWISPLGLERMLFALRWLEPWLTDADRAALRRVLVSEATWQHREGHRGGHGGVCADVWGDSGRNNPESNIWNGAILWRAATWYPDEPDAAAWRELAHRFLINGVSVAADATEATLVAGRPVAERHVGANFFDHYALDHHGYFNVGYQVICLSNAAMLHFDLLAGGHEPPESLYWHQADLWATVRRTIFADGRLARLGGDSRVRYAYCQEYLLPTLPFAADRLGEEHAGALATGVIETIAREADHNGDGGFYSRRLADLRRQSPYYYTRLESDRACALAQLVSYCRQLDRPPGGTRQGFEESVAGGWSEPAYGAALHRCPTRLAAFAWRAHGLTQGLCLPPGDGHLAEWSQNLAGEIRFVGDDGQITGGQTKRRRLLTETTHTFDGGFATLGCVREGLGLELAEGWRSDWLADHWLAFVALPDERTVVGLQLCRTGPARAWVASVKGLHLNVPIDLFSAFRRTLETARGEAELAVPAGDVALGLDSRWAVFDGCLAAVGLYGAETLTLDRAQTRRGGKYRSLFVDEVCWGHRVGPFAADPGTTLLDCAWATLASAGAEDAAALAEEAEAVPLRGDGRAVRLPGFDGEWYLVVANFGAEPVTVAGGERLAGAGGEVAPGDVAVWREAG